DMVPPTLATHITFSPTLNSRASPSWGKSDAAHSRVIWGMDRLARLLRLQGLRDHHLALEILDHAGLEPNLRRTLGQRHLVNLVLQLEQGVKEVFRPGRASDDVHIHRHDLV